VEIKYFKYILFFRRFLLFDYYIFSPSKKLHDFVINTIRNYLYTSGLCAAWVPVYTNYLGDFMGDFCCEVLHALLCQTLLARCSLLLLVTSVLIRHNKSTSKVKPLFLVLFTSQLINLSISIIVSNEKRTDPFEA